MLNISNIIPYVPLSITDTRASCVGVRLFNIMPIIGLRRLCVLARTIISIMLNSLGLVFCGAFFGVCRVQLFGFCPRVLACWRWRQKTMCCSRVGKKRDTKKQQKGWRGWASG